MSVSFVFIFSQCFFALQITFYIFHFLVLLLLIKKRDTTFKGSFYDIFKFLLIDDLVYFLITIPAKYIPEYGLWHEFFISPSYYGTVFLAIYSFLLQAEFFGSTLLALNRFTILWNSRYHNTIWRYHWYIAVILIAPFGIMYHYTIPSIYLFSKNGVSFIILGGPKSAEPYKFYTFVFGVTTLLEGIITIGSFIKYYQMLKTAISKQIKKQEIRLLFVSCIIFIAQIFRCFYSSSRSAAVFPDELELNTELNNIALDICAISRSISLIILSSATRKAFKEFYFSKTSTFFSSSGQVQVF